ncbi:hypothetical protein CYLTODRAFT_456491 [Cylindrobasidium torrendii FP15055 ss-10]|uniref:Uncharacterized protein n=1 Tax=Cylindrobasidium torrendii FP15055 ss-10 TaxID=1314674 RepID=A0A0D7B6V6_9AGAR|nr:hypothetical protein CYLTODRAFT_456491 [Cylindrobasidium torrendii FP15055 ss-10]
MHLTTPGDKDSPDDGDSGDKTSDSDYDTAPDNPNDIGMWEIDPELLQLMQSVKLNGQGLAVDDHGVPHRPRRPSSLNTSVDTRPASGGSSRHRVRHVSPVAAIQEPIRGSISAAHETSDIDAGGPARRGTVTALAGRRVHASVLSGDSITAPVARVRSHRHQRQDPPPPYTPVNTNPVANASVGNVAITAPPSHSTPPSHLVCVFGRRVGIFPNTAYFQTFLRNWEHSITEEYTSRDTAERAYAQARERGIVGYENHQLPPALDTALTPLNANSRTVHNTSMVREGRAKRYYIVYFGRQPGIFDNWLEAGLSLYKIDTATNYPDYQEAWDVTTNWATARRMFHDKVRMGRIVRAEFP